MHNLEEVREYGVKSYEQGKSLQEFNKLTKLRTLKIKWDFDFLDKSKGLSQAEGFHSYVGNLLSSCNIYNLYITDISCRNMYPLSLDSWHGASPYSLRKLWMKECFIYKVPNWMGSLGNLVELKLSIICLRPEDVEILGAIPSLLFLKLQTFGGTNGRITVHGSNGFRSLKYFSLQIGFCGTALEFQVGSMPNLEHVKLKFRVHKEGCLNGAFGFGIQHLSALSKAEVESKGNYRYYGNYDPTEDKNDSTVRCVASAINGAIMTLPNRPTIKFETGYDVDCCHFEHALRSFNRENGAVWTKWLDFLQIGEEQTELGTDGGTEREDETDEEEELEQTDEEENWRSKEAQS